MSKSTDVQIKDIKLYFLPVETRVPLKFGNETLNYVTCARAWVRIEDASGRSAEGWGETPLSVQWVWPSTILYEKRHQALRDFCVLLAKEWRAFDIYGHPIETSHLFQKEILPEILKNFNSENGFIEHMPYLAALVCCSLFDIALHDAYGVLHNLPVYETYNKEYMSRDLSEFLTPAGNTTVAFKNKYPCDYLVYPRKNEMLAWHLVGGMDPVTRDELSETNPDDAYPVLLEDWIKQDGLKCLKIKLRGNDAKWDYGRLVKVGFTALKNGVLWLTADFNCMVDDPAYVNDILDMLLCEYPSIYAMILYVEQPFPYNLENNIIDVHSVSARKPLFMDESAHDWQLIKLGRTLGWTGVALKTCKTQTGAILSLCWAKAHGMTLMVQDLTNPMLAQIPHVLLAAHAGTIMGVETNSMQFYPDASACEAKIHPGIYKRTNGKVELSTLCGPGFGYNIEKISRELPEESLLEQHTLPL